MKMLGRSGEFVQCCVILVVLLVQLSEEKRMIQVKDTRAPGEDPVIARELEARMGSGVRLDYPDKMPKKYQENDRIYSTVRNLTAPNYRRNPNPIPVYQYEPSVRELKFRPVDVMQQYIYVIQYRLRDLQNRVKKFGQDMNFLMGYIFATLDSILLEMHVLLTMLKYSRQRRPVHENIIYYTYFVKKNIEVTYIVEHVLELQRDNKRKEKEKAANATASLSGNDIVTDNLTNI